MTTNKLNSLPPNYIYITQNQGSVAHLLSKVIPAIYTKNLDMKFGATPEAILYEKELEELAQFYSHRLPNTGNEVRYASVNDAWWIADNS